MGLHRALCIPCTHHKLCCPLQKKYETSVVCSRSSQLNVAKVLTKLHVPNRLDDAGQITVTRYALFIVAVPHTLGSCRCGRTQAKGQPKRAVQCRSGSGVTVPYRNGLLEPRARPGHDSPLVRRIRLIRGEGSLLNALGRAAETQRMMYIPIGKYRIRHM